MVLPGSAVCTVPRNSRLGSPALCSRVLSSNRHSILLPIEINMRLNRGRPRAFPSISFLSLHVESKIGHRDRIKALGLCRIDRYDRGMGRFRRAGTEGDRTEKAVGKDPVERGVPKGEGWCIYTFVYFSGYTTEKSYEVGE